MRLIANEVYFKKIFCYCCTKFYNREKVNSQKLVPGACGLLNSGICYFHGQGITPDGFFVPLKMMDTSQLLGFLEAWLSFDVVIS